MSKGRTWVRCQRSEPEQAKKISIVGEGGTAGDGSQVPPGRMASPWRGRLVWNAGAPVRWRLHWCLNVAQCGLQGPSRVQGAFAWKRKLVVEIGAESYTAELSKKVTMLKIMKSRFLSVWEGSYRCSREEN